MGDKISIADLKSRTARFFARAVRILAQRNEVRGDSYLEMDLDDLAAMFRDKGGRVKTAGHRLENLTQAGRLPQADLLASRRELIDACLDLAGYAGLMSILLEENYGVTDDDWKFILARCSGD